MTSQLFSEFFLYQLLRMLIPMAQLALALGLCSRGLTPRPRPALRAAAVVALTVAFACINAYAAITSEGGPLSFDVIDQVLGSLTVFVLGGVGMIFLFDAEPVRTLSACVAGYTIQNLASSLGGLFNRVLWDALPDANGAVLLCVVGALSTTAAFVPCYLLFVRRVQEGGLSAGSNARVLQMFLVVGVLVIGFDRAVEALENSELVGDMGAVVLALRIFHVLACAFVLAMLFELTHSQELQRDAAVFQRILDERSRQYELSQQTIDAINVKCHDMRHQIRRLAEGGGIADAEVLADMEHQIAVYDSAVRTGSGPLDTILTEKRLFCEGAGITLSCIADGPALDFMAPADVYALFGNALDNAIRAVSALPRELRSISLDVHACRGLVSVSVENYFDEKLELADGLPVSRRGEGHGFGMHSMDLIARRYGGGLSVSAEGGTFRLSVVMPSPVPAEPLAELPTLAKMRRDS